MLRYPHWLILNGISMVAQSPSNSWRPGRGWATLWPTWIQSLEAVGWDPGRWWWKIYLSGISVFFSWSVDQNSETHPSKAIKSHHIFITPSSNFIKQVMEIQRTLAGVFRLRSWVKYCESILKVVASCWAQPWLVYLPPLQMINGQTAAWAGIVSGVKSNLRSSAIQCHWCGESRLEISWDILRWELLSRDFVFFLRHLVHKSVALNMVKSHLWSAMATSCTDISHIKGVSWNGIFMGHLKSSWYPGYFNTFVMVIYPWRLDENMRKWWELDLCTYLRYSSVISTKVTLHYQWVYEYIYIYDLYDIIYDIMPMSYSPGLPPWRLRNLGRHRNGLGDLWRWSLLTLLSVVARWKAGECWRWCWVRNKTTLKGLTVCWIFMHFFDTSRLFQTFWWNGFKWSDVANIVEMQVCRNRRNWCAAGISDLYATWLCEYSCALKVGVSWNNLEISWSYANVWFTSSSVTPTLPH